MGKNKLDYERISLDIMNLVGSKDNVTFFAHCTTRLRFNVKDKGLVRDADIDQTTGVLGHQWQGEQLQIIIGQNVTNVYRLICEQTGLESQDTIHENLDEKQKLSFSTIIDIISGCFTPILPALVGGGMLKGVIALLGLANVLSATSDTYTILSLIADAPFYFLPFLVAVSTSKKFKVNTYMALWLAGILVYPTLVGAYKTGSMSFMKFFGAPMLIVNYTSTIIPIILGVWILSKIYNFIDKRLPGSLKLVLVPMITMLITSFIVLIAAGPLASYISIYLEKIISWLFDFSGPVGGIVFGGLLAPIVVTGMHWIFLPSVYQSIALNGFDYFFMPIGVCSNISQGIAALTICLKTKNKDLRSLSLSTGGLACLGITEPAMYGVTLKYKKAYVMAMIGSACGSAYVMGMGSVASAFATSGVLALPLFIVNGNAGSLMNELIGIAITVVVTFVLTYFFGTKDLEEK